MSKVLVDVLDGKRRGSSVKIITSSASPARTAVRPSAARAVRQRRMVVGVRCGVHMMGVRWCMVDGIISESVGVLAQMIR